MNALKAAATTRGSLRGALFHCDHGSTYTASDYRNLCSLLGVTQSMGAIGSSADNALAESFNATCKREILAGARAWPDPETCRRDIFRWATRYNTHRRHSACGNESPDHYEENWATNLTLTT